MTREAVKLSEEAVKLSALGAKNLAALCLAMAKDNQKLKGKTKLKRLLTEGKELRVFDLKEEDVSAFAKEAKTYGILFSTIRNTKSARDTVDVIVKAEDAARINRIFENMGYAVPERAKKENIILNLVFKEEKLKKQVLKIVEKNKVMIETNLSS